MKPRPLLIIVSGLPAAGKTHVSQILAKEFQLPLFSRDDISEILFDNLELEPQDWSGNHRRTSYVILYSIMAKTLEAGQPLVVESSFGAEIAKQRFAQWTQQFDYEPFQIIVTADTDILLQRYQDRINDPATSSKSHPVHFAYLTYERYKEKLEAGSWTTEPVDIGGESWRIDTSDVTQVKYDELIAKISSKLKGNGN